MRRARLGVVRQSGPERAPERAHHTGFDPFPVVPVAMGCYNPVGLTSAQGGGQPHIKDGTLPPLAPYRIVIRREATLSAMTRLSRSRPKKNGW
jgi:hypothetical protein